MLPTSTQNSDDPNVFVFPDPDDLATVRMTLSDPVVAAGYSTLRIADVGWLLFVIV